MVKGLSVRICAAALSTSVIFSLSGCADLKNKFVRKKKETQVKRYYAVKEYHVTPSLDLYMKRYVLWKNWIRQLQQDLNARNFKKPLVAAEQTLSNLEDMQGMLVDEKAEALQKYVDEMDWVYAKIKKEKVTTGNQVQLKKRIDVVAAEVQRKFAYGDMKNHIRKEFDGRDYSPSTIPPPMDDEESEDDASSSPEVRLEGEEKAGDLSGTGENVS